MKKFTDDVTGADLSGEPTSKGRVALANGVEIEVEFFRRQQEKPPVFVHADVGQDTLATALSALKAAFDKPQKK